MRKPVGLATDQHGWTIVVCDDGTVYRMSAQSFLRDNPTWEESSPIPGTPAAKPKATAPTETSLEELA